MRTPVLTAVFLLAACSQHEPRAAAPPKPPTADSPPPAKPIASKPTTPSFHNFIPSRHGFHFRNGFQGSFFGTGESVYGLCGGMSFAAADYYLAGRDIPPNTHAPADGTPLYKYLYSRQATSFGTLGAMALKFGEWMQLPDDTAHARTLAELPHIQSALDRGDPIVLGLVLTSTAAKGKAWDNHQVLAFAAESGEDTILRIYDSNFPNRDDITISIRPTRIAMHIPGRRDIPIRGFFRMAYTPITPP